MVKMTEHAAATLLRVLLYSVKFSDSPMLSSFIWLSSWSLSVLHCVCEEAQFFPNKTT